MLKQLLIGMLFLAPLVLCAQSQGMLYNGKPITIQQCLELADRKQQEGDIREATRYLNQAAAIHWEKKEYAPAIQYFEQSIRLNETIGNDNGIAMISNNLGMLYADLQQYEKSLGYFESTLKTRRANKEKIGIISALINISVVLNNLKRYNESIAYLEESLALATEMSDVKQMRSCYGMLAETYDKAGNRAKSLEYFNLYRTFHELEQRKKEEGFVKDAETARLSAQLAEAEKKNKELELFKKERELTEKQQKITELGAELSGMDKAARQLMESATKQELALRVLKRENELTTLNLKKQEEKLNHERFVRNILLGSLVVILLLGILMLINYLQKRKKHQLLVLQNAEITRQRAEIQYQSEQILSQYKDLQEAKTTIKEQNSQLLEYNKNLEQQVEDRTRQLIDANSELLQQNTQLEQYAFVTAHNLRGPVARILGLISIVNHQNAADPVNMMALENVRNETQRLDEVINDMNQILEIQKSTTHELEALNLRDRIEHVLESFTKDLQELHAVLTVEVEADTMVYFIKAYMDSILYNLISNAIKYRNPTRTLQLAIRSEQADRSFICICVSDNGLGLDLSRYGNQLFNLYKRFHLHKDGKGLGLYLTKTQMEAMGGKIEVESQVDAGTTFRLCFRRNIEEENYSSSKLMQS